MERYMRGEAVGQTDWAASWRVAGVDDDEWESLQQRLDAAYQRLRATMQGVTTGDGVDAIGGPLAILGHTAYHLGEIRQALCTIRR